MAASAALLIHGLSELLRELICASLYPVVGELTITDLPYRDAGELNRAIVGRGTEYTLVVPRDYPARHDARAVGAAEHVEALQPHVADLRGEGACPLLEGSATHDVTIWVREDEVIGA